MSACSDEVATVEPVAVHTYPGTLFDYTAGVFCGVLVTEPVMRKLAKLQAEHLEQVTRLLCDSEGGVFPSMWTLHHPDGKQTSVHFIDTSRTVAEAVKNAVHTARPIPRFPVFVASSMDSARAMADARHAASGDA